MSDLNDLRKSSTTTLHAEKAKGASIIVIPDAETASMLELLAEAGVMGASSKRDFARNALKKAVKERFAWAKEKGIL